MPQPRAANAARARSTSAPRTRARIIGLDGARGLSCLGVAFMHITGHFSPHTSATYKTNLVGMSLIFFYALSGFLLFLPYVRNLTEERSVAKLPSTKNFAAHRIARIIPGYLAIFLLCNFVFQVAYVTNPALEAVGTDDGTGMITNPGQLLANLTLVQSYIPKYFQTGLNPTWSLTLEYAFYAALPLLGMLLFRLRRTTALRPLMLATIAPLLLLVIGFVGRLFIPLVIARTHVVDPALIDWGPNWAAVYARSLLTNADNFAAGMLAAMVFVAMEQGSMREWLSRRVRLYSAILLLPVLALSAILLAGRSPFSTSAIGVECALMILVIVAPLARGQGSAIARWLDLAPVRYVGKVSLSAYLWHYPVMLLLFRARLMAGDTLSGMIRNVVVALTATMLISTVTYYLVESPAMNLARRYRYRWA